ncbi:MAG: C-GCAxxG-C-C family protein [Anaerolineae bacterium]|nr:C-GCAxxG-C-C family protein [Anaerolineae bacterium]
MLFAVGEHALGQVPEACVRMASVLAGGIGGSQQELCGALAAGVLIIGGLLGRRRPGEDDRPALALVARYRERFLAELGATQCARVRELMKAPGGLRSCARVVERAAAILLELLEEVGQQGLQREPCGEKG